MRIIALVVLALLTAPGVAMAKGPLSGSVSGPGLAAPIKLDGTGEWDEDSPLALLTADTGIYDRSRHPPRPAGELGPRYEVRLVFPRHSTGKPANVVRQHLYPYAEHGPVVYTVGGQRIFDDNASDCRRLVPGAAQPDRAPGPSGQGRPRPGDGRS